MQLGGNKQVLKFLNWIYKDASIFIQRKKDIYENILTYYANGSIRSYMTYTGRKTL